MNAKSVLLLPTGLTACLLFSLPLMAEVTAPRTVREAHDTYIKFSSRSLFLQNNTQILFSQPQGSVLLPSQVEQIQNRLERNDVVLFEYELNEMESRQARVRDLENEIKKMEALRQERSLIREELLRQDRNKAIIKIVNAENAITLANMKIAIAERERESLIRGVSPVPKETRLAEFSLEKMSQTEIDQFLQNRILNESRILSIKVVPAESVARARFISKASWTGVMGALIAGGAAFVLLSGGEEVPDHSKIAIFRPELVRP